MFFDGDDQRNGRCCLEDACGIEGLDRRYVQNAG
jgi:hypothetical protein